MPGRADDEGVIDRGVGVCVCRTLDLTGGGGGGERQRGASERQPPPLITRCALHNNNNNNIPGADLSGTHIYIGTVRSEAVQRADHYVVLLTVLSRRIYMYNIIITRTISLYTLTQSHVYCITTVVYSGPL